ncbi:hypothetical protein PR048_032185 [Dryococelus australis]|uniref:Uncharacterized protein n=1 Tax=Dryococelus australis TaxID=614101 RepID=A0ABQ9G2P8_9NEOP|nr:hypothetical protein PR048_032185 [Dryococelus australis]
MSRWSGAFKTINGSPGHDYVSRYRRTKLGSRIAPNNTLLRGGSAWLEVYACPRLNSTETLKATLACASHLVIASTGLNSCHERAIPGATRARPQKRSTTAAIKKQATRRFANKRKYCKRAAEESSSGSYYIQPTTGQHGPADGVSAAAAVIAISLRQRKCNAVPAHARLPPKRNRFNPPGRVTGFSQVGIVPGDAVGRRVLSGISRFARPFGRRSTFTSITRIGSQDRAVKEPPKSLHSRARRLEGDLFSPRRQPEKTFQRARRMTTFRPLQSVYKPAFGIILGGKDRSAPSLYGALRFVDILAPRDLTARRTGFICRRQGRPRDSTSIPSPPRPTVTRCWSSNMAYGDVITWWPGGSCAATPDARCFSADCIILLTRPRSWVRGHGTATTVEIEVAVVSPARATRQTDRLRRSVADNYTRAATIKLAGPCLGIIHLFEDYSRHFFAGYQMAARPVSPAAGDRISLYCEAANKRPSLAASVGRDAPLYCENRLRLPPISTQVLHMPHYFYARSIEMTYRLCFGNEPLIRHSGVTMSICDSLPKPMKVRRGEYESVLEYKGEGKQQISEKTHRSAESSGTILTCGNPGVTPKGIEPETANRPYTLISWTTSHAHLGTEFDGACNEQLRVLVETAGSINEPSNSPSFSRFDVLASPLRPGNAGITHSPDQHSTTRPKTQPRHISMRFVNRGEPVSLNSSWHECEHCTSRAPSVRKLLTAGLLLPLVRLLLKGDIRTLKISAPRHAVFQKRHHQALFPRAKTRGVTRPGIEPGSPWWEACRLTAQPPWPQLLAGGPLKGAAY